MSWQAILISGQQQATAPFFHIVFQYEKYFMERITFCIL